MLTLLAAMALASPPQDPPAESLADLADRYCIDPDGDHRLTWHRAEQDGFRWMTPEDIPRLHLPGTFAPNLRGLQRTSQGTTIRILTSAFRWTAPDDGRTFFRQCWISASTGNLDETRKDLGVLLNVRSFRSREVVVFAWIPRPNGAPTSVSRRDYLRRVLTLSREQGMRQIMLRQYEGSVFVGYSSPRDEATYRDFDWAGPEPMAAPE
jgi:hypothetical protein